ncbi:MAG: LCP family protein, partial [Anaerolineae bacterium]|nr:LCP family protein [Anaerolineae bacterium]
SVLLAMLIIAVIYLLFPLNINILILGIDRAPEGTALGRSDTIMLTQARPLSGKINLLSVPRDLWVAIPGYGEERINAAHYFGEAAETGSGPQLAAETIEANFGFRTGYTVRIQLENFPAVVDALGGVDLLLENSMGGLPPGEHHLDGTQALAFVRDRAGTDDFYRMAQGQVMGRALFYELLDPANWLRIPAVLGQAVQVVEVDIPLWQWPRLLLVLLRAGPDGIHSESLTREMAVGFTTSSGAQVLLPQWELITPLVKDLFGG